MNGKYKKPNEEDTDEFERWIKIDCMVQSWILNSISREIVDAFLYITSAQELWERLEERFEVYNGPLLYQLQREFNSLMQGNQSVSQYFTKLKRL